MSRRSRRVGGNGPASQPPDAPEPTVNTPSEDDGAATVDELIVALRDPDPGKRRTAAEALGRLGDAQAVTALIEALDDPFESWSQYPDERSPVSGGYPVREAAIWALENIGDPAAIHPLADRLGDSLAKSALVGISRVHHEEVVSHLVRRLEADAPIPAAAASVLAEIGDPGVVPELVTAIERFGLLGYLTPSLIDSLKRIGGPEAERFLDAYRNRYGDDEARTVVLRLASSVRWGGSGREKAAREVESLQGRATIPLIELLGHADNLVRWQSARSLGRIGDTRAVEPLARLLDDSDPGVREAAIGALERIGGPDVDAVLPRHQEH